MRSPCGFRSGLSAIGWRCPLATIWSSSGARESSKSTIDHRVVRHGVVSSAGDLTIEADAEVGAAYEVGENCRIDPGAVVDGYVRVTGYGGQIAQRRSAWEFSKRCPPLSRPLY